MFPPKKSWTPQKIFRSAATAQELYFLLCIDISKKIKYEIYQQMHAMNSHCCHEAHCKKSQNKSSIVKGTRHSHDTYAHIHFDQM